MPIYEYKCSDCGNKLEIMQKISDEPLRECPRCQGKLEKQWSLSGFQFKGTGWYVSDYGKQGADAERKAESKAQNTADSGSDKNTENKTEKSAGDKNALTGGSDAKTSSSNESTVGTSSASKPETKAADNKPIAKTE